MSLRSPQHLRSLGKTKRPNLHFIPPSPSISDDAARIIVSSKARYAAHSVATKLGLISNVFVASALIHAYCKSSRMADARRIFDGMNFRNAVAWNSLIRGYSEAGSPSIALEIFHKMIADAERPTAYTISIALLACKTEHNASIVHCLAVKFGFCSNIVVASSLVDMYAKCSSSMENSQKMFEEMRERNVITWTSIITGYAGQRRAEEAMDLLREMTLTDVPPNELTFSGLLCSFADRRSLIYGKQIHSLAIRRGMEANPYLSSALIAMYSKCGSSEDFLQFVRSDPSDDQVLENSIVSGFSHLKILPQAMRQFVGMKRRSVDVDFYTFGSLLLAVGSDSAIREGKQVHALITRTGFFTNIYVQNGLVAMYARCGEIDDSERAFSEIDRPDLVSWNSLISGLALHGQGRRALGLFDEMQTRGVDPDETTFLSVLSACDHSGLVDQGLRSFDLMRKIVDRPATQHYSSLVDLLGRAGYLKQAESLVNAFGQKSTPSVYRSLLNSCKIHGDTETALRATAQLLELCSHEPSSYVAASNLFAEMREWGISADVRDQMAERGLKKEAGKSLIDGQDKLKFLHC